MIPISTLRLCLLLPMWLLSAASAKEVTVAKDGSGDFATVQAAIDAVPVDNAQPFVIVIKPGTYKERLEITRDKRHVTLRGAGDDPADVVLTYDLHAKSIVPPSTQPVGTSGSTSTRIAADDFTAENLTFENPSGQIAQAVAVKADGDRAIFRRCRFLGGQDTLYLGGGRAYLVDCYVEGRVDFIFGRSAAVFERCTIHSKNGGYVTAANTKPEQPFGFVFLDCTLTGDGEQPAYLGRPWQWDRGSKAAVAFIRCKMGPHVRPEGWNKWDRPDNPNLTPAENTRYVEFGSTDLEGRPLDVSQRVPWSRQLTPEDAERYTVKHVLGGEDGWDPTGAK
jgi:pectinesterase